MKPGNLALITALVNLLAVMKTNPDGSRTIEGEHQWVIDEAKELVRKAFDGCES